MNYEFLIIGYFFIKIPSFIPGFLIHDSAQSFTLACVHSPCTIFLPLDWLLHWFNIIIIYACSWCTLYIFFIFLCALLSYRQVFSLGWPKLQWFVTANLNRHPKDWQPPSNLDRSSPAYIEVCKHCGWSIVVHEVHHLFYLLWCH